MTELYIFDVDGTILDSMPMWSEIGNIYIRSKGLEPPERLNDTLRLLTSGQAAFWLSEHIPELGLDPETIGKEMVEMIHYQYKNVIQPFEKPLQLVKKLQSEKAPMVVLSTSDADCITMALNRLGILDGFMGVHTGDQLGMGKQDPEIYRVICSMYGAKPENTVIYDDSDYAIEAARKAGLTVIDAADII